MKALFTASPIRRQIIALIVFMQIVATTLAILFIQGLLGGGLATPRAVATEVIGPFSAVLNATMDLSPNGQRTAMRSLLARDDRFALLAQPELVASAELWAPGKFYLRAARDKLDTAQHHRIAIVHRQVFERFPLTVGNYGIAFRLAEREWLVFTPSAAAPARMVPLFVLILVMALLTLPLSAFLVWATSMLVAPLRRLAAAADGFSHDLDAGEAPEKGSAEVRTVARAFNAMRARLKAMIDAKSHTLAAIGHDLKTPLTRMRLRLESEPVDREALRQDVRAMEAMVASALSFIRDGEATMHRGRVDLTALTQAICDDLVDLGHTVEAEPAARVVVLADANLLRRALTNVIENACTYGTNVTVRVVAVPAARRVDIVVADNGPGLSPDDYGNAMEPFWRGDAARTRAETTGFGLGLSIARTILERHDGAIALAPNTPTGLIVTLSLPL